MNSNKKNTYFNKITVSIFYLLAAFRIYSLPNNNDSLRFEILLSKKLVDSVKLNDKFINTLEITPSRYILLSTANQFYVLGWGGIKPVGEKLKGNIHSFAFTPDKLLMAVQNNELSGMDTLGNLTKLFKLPNDEMGISTGESVMYVYDRNKKSQKHSLYVVAKGAKYAKLFDMPSPIVSVVEMQDSILFACQNVLFSFNLKNKKLKALVSLPKNTEIKSIAVDNIRNRIYFSADNSIYSLKNSKALTITNQFGGILKFFNEGLIVFNSNENLLIRIVGLESTITSKIQEVQATSNGSQVSTTGSISPPSTNSTTVSANNYYIIIGSFKTVQEANAEVSSMKNKGFSNAKVVGKSGAGTWRVSYKSFATKEAAMKELPNLDQLYPSAWILTNNGQ